VIANKNQNLWIDEGYQLFAHEGTEGIQIERLARITQLNKSGFYHYFGDLEGYCMELGRHHRHRANLFVNDVGTCRSLDPDYFHTLVRHAVTVMFQVQLTRRQEHHAFYEMSQDIDEKVNLAIQHMWSDYLGVERNLELSLRYFNIVRDTFYTRVNFQNLTYQFLHNLAKEAKALLDQSHTHENANVARATFL
jgi:AcrR family transcriptional regulator